MLRFLAEPNRLCDGTSRREILRLGGLGSLGLWGSSLFDATPARAGSTLPVKAKTVVFFNLWGGPSHLDTFDPKPDAPADIRGEFDTIPTSVNGLRITEYLPKLARQAHLYSLIRSVSHQDTGHGSAMYTRFSGWPHPQLHGEGNPTPDDHPPYGAVMAALRPPSKPVPPFLIVGGITANAAGQTGGLLGQTHAPMIVEKDPSDPAFEAPGLSPLVNVPSVRLQRRRRLLDQVTDVEQSLERQSGENSLTPLQDRAFRLLSNDSIRGAFDVSREADTTRDRYGRHPVGQNLLLTRRLVEAGVPAIQVSWNHRGPWDTHGDNFNTLKGMLLPRLDESLSAFFADLHDRGLLDSTLVMVCGEFGRSPKISDIAGRDHWPACYTALMAGGGIRPGLVYGASDDQGAYPAEDAVGPWDLGATVYRCAGIDPRAEIVDLQGRPQPISMGTAIDGLL